MILSDDVNMRARCYWLQTGRRWCWARSVSDVYISCTMSTGRVCLSCLRFVYLIFSFVYYYSYNYIVCVLYEMLKTLYWNFWLIWLTKCVNYGRPLSVAWAKSMLCFTNVIYLFIFLWPPYAPAQVNGGSRNFYTWWTLSVNREVTTWIFHCPP